jgi:hypothetical protein
MPQLSVFAKAMPTYINQKKLTDTITIVNQDFDDMVFSKRVDVVSESITRSLNLNRWNLIKGMSPSDVNKWLSEFALYLAYNPAELNQWAGEQLTTGIKLMLSNPELPCFVRSLVLISHY